MARARRFERIRFKQPSAAILHECEDDRIGKYFYEPFHEDLSNELVLGLSLATDARHSLEQLPATQSAIRNISRHLNDNPTPSTRGQTASNQQGEYAMSSEVKSGNMSNQILSRESKMPAEELPITEAGQRTGSSQNTRRSIFGMMSLSKIPWVHRRSRDDNVRKLVISAPMDPKHLDAAAVFASFDDHGQNSKSQPLPTATASLVDLSTGWQKMETVAPRYGMHTNSSVPADLNKIYQSQQGNRNSKVLQQLKDSAVLRKAKDLITDLIPEENVEPSDELKRSWLRKETPFVDKEDIAKRNVIQANLRSDEPAITAIHQNPSLARFFGDDPTSIDTAPAVKYTRPITSSDRKRYTVWDVDGTNFPDYDNLEELTNTEQSSDVQHDESGSGVVAKSDTHQIVEEALPHVTTTHRTLETIQESPSTAQLNSEVAHHSVKHARESVGTARQSVGYAQDGIHHAQDNVGYAQENISYAQSNVDHARQSVGHARLSEGVGPSHPKVKYAHKPVGNAHASNAHASDCQENIGLAVTTVENIAQPAKNVCYTAGNTHKILRKPLPSTSKVTRAHGYAQNTTDDTLQNIPNAFDQAGTDMQTRASTSVLEVPKEECDLFEFFPGIPGDPKDQLPLHQHSDVMAVVEPPKAELRSDEQDSLIEADITKPPCGKTETDRQHDGIKPKRASRFLKMRKSIQKLFGWEKSTTQPMFPVIPEDDGLSMSNMSLTDSDSSAELSLSSVNATQGGTGSTLSGYSCSRDELVLGYGYGDEDGLQDLQAHGNEDDYEDWSWFPLMYKVGASAIGEV